MRCIFAMAVSIPVGVFYREVLAPRDAGKEAGIWARNR